MTTGNIKTSKCLHCGEHLEDATTGSDDTPPQPGSILICVYCGHLMSLAEDLNLRELTDEEMKRIAGDPKLLELQEVAASIREVMGKRLTPEERRVLECRSVKDKMAVPIDCALVPVGTLNAVTSLIAEGYMTWMDRAPINYNGTLILCDVFQFTRKGIALCEKERIRQR